MILEVFPVGPLAANCILIGDEQAGEALVIDPGAEAKRIHRRVTELGLKVKEILLTHAHIDHVGAAFQLKHLTDAPIYLHENDLELLNSLDAQAAWLGMVAPEVSQPDEGLHDGQTVGLERINAKVLHSPGHTQGSVCFYFAAQGLLIAGDTLFAGSVGRTDLPGGNYEHLMRSLQTQLMPLPDETRVISGHGPATTIGEERRNNPFLRTNA
jgi:glyoxylase-like metal-dependent hydrolase (beta-lactamase superfamily II)